MLMTSRKLDLAGSRQVSVDGIDMRRIDDSPLGCPDKAVWEGAFQFIQSVSHPKGIVSRMGVDLFSLCFKEEDVL